MCADRVPWCFTRGALACTGHGQAASCSAPLHPLHCTRFVCKLCLTPPPHLPLQVSSLSNMAQAYTMTYLNAAHAKLSPARLLLRVVGFEVAAGGVACVMDTRMRHRFLREKSR